MNKRRILLVDDHRLVRSALRALLESAGDLEVIGEASSTSQALEFIKQVPPDLALIDISMPGLSGIELVVTIKRRWPGIKALIVSMHRGVEYVNRAIQAGADGYLFKDAGADELREAIDLILRGGTYLSPGLASSVTNRRTRDPLTELSARQRQILELIAQSRSTKEIAEELFISAKTVETHRSQLMRKLGLKDVAGLVRFAIGQGIVPIDKN